MVFGNHSCIILDLGGIMNWRQ
uniref:Uncharacterized protein n=1 Tax=Arundo donax TaxID=35708 RepID=A0A0A9BKR1_ARUDO